MSWPPPEVEDALVQGLWIGAGAAVIVGIATWSIEDAFWLFLIGFCGLGIAPAIYQEGRRDRR